MSDSPFRDPAAVPMSATPSDQVELTDATSPSTWRQLLTSGAVFLWLVAILIYVLQPDLLAALFLLPPWCWVVAGLLLTALGYSRYARRWSLLALTLWFLFSLVFVEPMHQLLRYVPRRASGVAHKVLYELSDSELRVVTLNCAGNARAALEAESLEPDIILLQESPGAAQTAEITSQFFGRSGSFIHHGDTSIIAAGELTDRTPADEQKFSHALLTMSDGTEIDLVSLRLSPPVFRMDFWSAGFWTDHRDRRADHRNEISRLVQHVQSTAPSGPLVLGGDFNTTPADLALTELKARAFDTFRWSGSGWGSTGTNESPLFRVDQIWASRDFRADVSFVKKTQHSDHRMVVSDLIIKSP